MVEYRVKVYKDRTVWRNLDDKLHRLDGPAIEFKDGSTVWYRDGKKHRENGPAIEWADGRKEWYIEGKWHTEEQLNAYIKKLNKPCAGKKMIVDGVEYELK